MNTKLASIDNNQMPGDGAQRPFIKKFKTGKHNYIYDVNSNNLIKVNQIIFDLIDETGENNADLLVEKFKHKYNPNDILRYYESIKQAIKERNCFSSHRPEIFSGFKSENDVKYVLNSNLNQIILELTARCNHRCKYCGFSGRYSYKRKHEQSDMTVATAKKAVEYFIEGSRGNKKEKSAAITFHGGESLLRFDLLKGVVELTKRKGVFNKYRFSLTTNGTLLTDEVIEYFVKNDISILVSIDGPKEIQDRYRVFRNGQGTYDVILKNLKRIKKYSPEYFENNVSFTAVISPPYDFDAVINFFYRRKFFEPFRDKISINFVDAYETTFFRDFNLEKDKKNLRNELNRLLKRYRRALTNGTYDKLTIEKQLFLENFYNIAYRPMVPIGGDFWPVPFSAPKALNNNGEGTIKSVTDSIDWLVSEGADIILLAFSAHKPSNRLYRSVHRALAAGVIVVAEAGTEDGVFADGQQAPGNYRGVYTVAATDEHGNPSNFSKEGYSTDGSAPSLEVWSLSRDGGYAQLSGGFVAAALVTGLLALLKARHLKSPDKDNPLDNCDDAHRLLRPMSKHPGRHDVKDGFGFLLPLQGFADILKKTVRKVIKILAKMVKDSSIT